MSCKHDAVQPFGPVVWCKHCGAVHVGDGQWQLTENEQREVWLDSLCPICESGEPLPIETKDGRKIQRWTCKHWLHLKSSDAATVEKQT